MNQETESTTHAHRTADVLRAVDASARVDRNTADPMSSSDPVDFA